MVKKIKDLKFKHFRVINITRKPLPRDWVEKSGYMDRKFIYTYIIINDTKYKGGMILGLEQII